MVLWCAKLPHPSLEDFQKVKAFWTNFKTPNNNHQTGIYNTVNSLEGITEHNYGQYNKHSLHHQLFYHKIAEKLVIRLGLMKTDGSHGGKIKLTGEWKHSCIWTKIKKPQRKNSATKAW